MKSIDLLDNVHFNSAAPAADPMYVDKNGRAILFALKPGQTIKPHDVPQSPFYVVVLQGHGYFAGADGKEQRFGPNALVVFGPGEEHLVRAADEELVFVGILHGAPSNVSDKVGGEIGRHPASG